MASKTKKRDVSTNPAEISDEPFVTTRAKRPQPDGFMRGIDGSAWLVREVPLGALRDTRVDAEKIQLGATVVNALDSLAAMTSGRALNRAAVKSRYREYRMLSLNIPARFEAPPELTTAPILNSYFSNYLTRKRVVFMAVRLRAEMKVSNVWQSFLQGAISVFSGVSGAPDSDFEKDKNQVHQLLARAQLVTPKMHDLQFADAWWNAPQGEHQATPNVAYVAHVDHLHFLHTTSAWKTLRRETRRQVTDVDASDCDTWPTGLVDSDEQSTVTFGAVKGFTFRPTSVTDPAAQWGMALLNDSGALAVSVSGLCEPAWVTKQEIRSQKRKFQADSREHSANSKETSVEAQDKLGEIEELVTAYSRDGAPSTSVDTRITIAFSSAIEDMKTVTPDGLVIDPMTNIQQAAWHEMMLCSSVEANPHLLDLPSTNIGFAGLNAVQRVGDNPVAFGRNKTVGHSVGAMAGFSERDRQPSFISGSPQAEGDNLPIAIYTAGTGSGKTLLLLWLAYQWHEQGYDQVIIDPKKTSDHTAVVQDIDGHVAKISDMGDADGPFDPVRWSPNKSDGVALSADAIQRADPFGGGTGLEFQNDIAFAIKHGVARGAGSTGAALRIAQAEGVIRGEIVDRIFQFAETQPMFRLSFGFGNDMSQSFSLRDGLTLVMVGDTEFELPPENTDAYKSDSALIRTSANLIRLLIRASTSSLSNRQAKIHMDEAWVVDRLAPGENQALGRLARALDIAFFQYTQTPSNPLQGGMASYVGRGGLGYQRSPEEAAAGMELFGLGGQQEVFDRIRSPRHNPSTGLIDPNSLQAFDEVHEGVQHKRGSVFYLTDINGRMAPVEVALPRDFITLASTRPDDIRERLASGTLPSLLKLPQRTNVSGRTSSMQRG